MSLSGTALEVRDERDTRIGSDRTNSRRESEIRAL
jgi:hypothetical protein